MSRRSRTLALAAGLAAATGLAGAAPRGGARGAERELLVENPDRGTVLRVRLQPGEVFSVVYHHSMYDQPVTEDFVLDEGGRIVLQAVTSPSAAVREYFGITSAGERHALRRTMPEIVFRIATGTAQRLRAGGVERSFLELGEHGDRLVLRSHRP
jgi:hypothetical protein